MLEMLHYDFMVRALLAGLMVGSICPAAGVFLVLRRYSFMAETLAHVSLAGAAIGMLLGIFPLVTTVTVVVLVAVTVELLRSRQKLYPDALLALVMSGGLALAVVLLSMTRGFNVDVMSYLFGSILTVTQLDLLIIIAVGLVVLGIIGFLFKELYFISFDEECARVAGLPVEWLNFIFILVVAGTISISVRLVGALLVSALMVIPVITAFLVACSFRQAFYAAVCLGMATTVSGLTVSYYLGTASGGTVVLLAVAIFGAVVVGKKLKSLFRCRLLLKAGSPSGALNPVKKSIEIYPGHDLPLDQ